MNEVELKCLTCNGAIKWIPNIILNEVSSFECLHCGQFYRADKVDFEKKQIEVVLVDRQEALDAMRQDGLI